MGITHFDGVSGVDGLYVGSSTGGETRVAGPGGYIYAGTGTANYRIDDATYMVFPYTFASSSAASQVGPYPVPYACDVVGVVVQQGSVFPAAPGTMIIRKGTAGDVVTTYSMTSAGTASSVQTTTAITGTASVTAIECLSATILDFHFRVFPVLAMASVK